MGMGPKTEGIGLRVLQSTPKTHAHTNKGSMHHHISFVLHALWRHCCSIKNPPPHTHTVCVRDQTPITVTSPTHAHFSRLTILLPSLQFLPLTSLWWLQSNKLTLKMWGMPTPHFLYRHQGQLADTGRQTLNFNLGVTCFFSWPLKLPTPTGYHHRLSLSQASTSLLLQDTTHTGLSPKDPGFRPWGWGLSCHCWPIMGKRLLVDMQQPAGLVDEAMGDKSEGLLGRGQYKIRLIFLKNPRKWKQKAGDCIINQTRTAFFLQHFPGEGWDVRARQ